LRLFALSGLVVLSSDKSFRAIDGEEIIALHKTIGFSEGVVVRVLRDLCELRFIATTTHEEPSGASSFFPTRLGGYVVRYLITNLPFLEAVMMDTFIADPDVWEVLKKQSERIDSERNTVERLKVRVERASTFFEYMRSLYDPMRLEAQRRGLPAEWCGDPLGEVERQFRINLDRALKSARKHYGRESAAASK
jgi:hypothetical protein